MSGFRQPFMAKRYGAGAYVAGRWIEGTPEDYALTASKQPASGEDLQKLPEGRRSGKIYKLFTATEMRTADETASTNADTITLEDGDYEVIHVAPWQNGVIPHYEVLVGRPSKRQAQDPPPSDGAGLTEGLVLS